MKKNFKNLVHVEGYVYDHSLTLKQTGPNSKNPGTDFISGELSIATDEACTNVVKTHFTYVTAQGKNGTNATFTLLKNIIDGAIGTVMANGKDKAGKVKLDTALDLNEFYSDRTGTEELVSAKRNEGGFLHIADTLAPEEDSRSAFSCDMLITGVRTVEANEDRGYPAKVIVKGAIFNFRKELLPVEFSATRADAMEYFEGLNASAKEPVFTEVRGKVISQTTVRTISEEGAFGTQVREVPSSYKDYVITWALPNPYLWDDESTLTAKDVTDMMAARELHLADIKKRQDEYAASRTAAAAPTSTTTAGAFNF